MLVMGKLTHEYKLTARTSPEVVEGVDVLLARRPFSAVKFRGRKIGKESLVGAVMLEFLRLPEAEQLAILGRRIPELEAQIDAVQDKAAAPGRDYSPVVAVRTLGPSNPKPVPKRDDKRAKPKRGPV